MHRTPHTDRRIEISLFDPKNRRTLSALLPDAFVRQIENLWNGENCRLLKIGEWELTKEAKRAGRPLSPQDHRLRAQFWFEYDQQQVNPDNHYPSLNMARVIGRATPKENFYRHIITDEFKLAFILTPPTDYVTGLTIALDYATQAMIEILELPVVFPGGQPDLAVAEKKARIIENFHRYARGLRGEVVNPPKEGRRPGVKMSDGAIEQAKREPTAAEKIALKKAEIAELEARKSDSVGSEQQ